MMIDPAVLIGIAYAVVVGSVLGPVTRTLRGARGETGEEEDAQWLRSGLGLVERSVYVIAFL